MCLYHYLYFSSCQHGELSLITYCDKAKDLDTAEQDSLSGADTSHPDSSPLSSQSSTASAANTHNLFYSHIQQQHRNMATLSPSKARTTLGCGNDTRPSSQHDTLTPRSAFQDEDLSSPSQPYAVATLHAIHVLNSNERDDALLSVAGSHQDLYAVESVSGTAARQNFDSDAETCRGSSEASIEIITEREPVHRNTVKFASPRKPLPTQWLQTPSHTATHSREHVDVVEPAGETVERKTIRASRSAADLGRAHAEGVSFLTKEALDAVDANIAPPVIRRSPSKNQVSEVRVPWNSPTVSPKIKSIRLSAISPTKSSPPRTRPLGLHASVEHMRAPSSIVSADTTSFYTAQSSPVRSDALSQTSSASTEIFNNADSLCCDLMANVNDEQIEGDNPSKSATIRQRTSRPGLSIQIPPPDSSLHAERVSASSLASATSTATASGGSRASPISPTQSSRIPRMSTGKGSSVRAPTLSSTLKQTKSTQALRSPKAANRNGEVDRPNTAAAETMPLRHVRTVDSTGSTPILSDRNSRDFKKVMSIVGLTRSVKEKRRESGDFGLLKSHLQNAKEQKQADHAKPPAISHNYNLPVDPGLVHSSDADDEYDGPVASVLSPREGVQNESLHRGHKTQYHHKNRLSTLSEVSMPSVVSSDLRATATEFIPGQEVVSTTNYIGEPPVTSTTLPDMYAMDGYGIPWFYHMYPVPWTYHPIWQYGKARSPKKFRHKKQRPSVNSSMETQQIFDKVLPSVETQTTPKTHSKSITRPEESRVDELSSHTEEQKESSNLKENSSKSSEHPFTTQFDMVSRQAGLQSNTVGPQAHSQVELTSVRNVLTRSQDASSQGLWNGNGIAQNRRQYPRRSGNGLYGGRGNVGMPLHATIPFPNPVPPMGRPTESHGNFSKAINCYNVDSRACGTVEIECAAEHGGRQACYTCEPDH